MSLVSLKFLVFVLICAIGYYVIPKKLQWVWLLIFSYIYYISAGINVLFFLVFTTVTTYGAGVCLEYLSNSSLDKKILKKRKKAVLITGLILNFGMLGVLKYTNFVIDNINGIIGVNIEPIDMLLPLGISFYTFQSMGYLMDVYWEKIKPERNLFKFALFVSFFPQILQGPIGRFQKLSEQFFKEHRVDVIKIKQACLRILWGFFKKMVMADNAGRFSDFVFNNYQTYDGMAILGVLCYSAQLYGDFSGGIDVVIGIAKLFDIELDENFRQPFFAKSITDFWHRWHITLGTWMKDYVFYPLTLSKFMNKLSKAGKKVFSKNIARALPVCISNIIVFLIVGVWHGAAWKFIVYGLYNGLIIGFSGLMAQTYKKWKKSLNISDSSKGFRLFQIVRTFILVNISWFFDRGDTVSQAFEMMKNAFTKFDIMPIINGEAYVIGESTNFYTLICIGSIIISTIIVFIVSVLKERGVDIKGKICAGPTIIYAVVCFMLIFSLPAMGQFPVWTGGFIYAQF